MAETAILRVKIDPSGAVTGSREVVASLDKINGAAGKVGGSVGRTGEVLGGLGLKASAVGAVIGGVTTTLTAFGAGISAAISEAADAQPRLAQLNATIASTGGVAGVTSAQAVALANSIEDLTAVDDDLVISAESILLTFTNISGAVFPRAVQAATDLSAKFGTDLNSAIKMVGRALDDPVHGLTLLTRAGVSFTAQQKDQIKALVESGQAMKAQEIVLGALETKVGGAGAAFRDTFQGSQEAAKRTLEDFGKTIGSAFLPMLQAAMELVVQFGPELQEFARFVASALSSATDSVQSFFRSIGQYVVEVLPKISELADAGVPGARALQAALIGVGEVSGRMVAAIQRGKDAAAAGSAANHELAGSASAVADAESDLTEKLDQRRAVLVELTRRVAEGAVSMEDYRAISAAVQELVRAGIPLESAYAQSYIDEAVAIDEATRALNDRQAALEALSHIQIPDLIPATDQIEKFLNTDGAKAAIAAADVAESVQTAGDRAKDARALLEQLFASGAVSADVYDKAIAKINASTGELTITTKDAADEWSKFQDQVNENFVRGAQDALAQFATDVLSGSGNALENFGNSIKKLLIDTAAQYFAKWAIEEAKRFATSMAHIAEENAARAAGSSGGSSGSGVFSGASALGSTGSGSSAWSSGGGWGGVAGFAAIAVALAVAMKWKDDQDNKKYYNTSAKYGFDDMGKEYALWEGKLNQTGQAVADALKKLSATIGAAAGGLLTDIPDIEIRIRNDKKKFQAVVGGEFVGTFTDLGMAIVEAFKRAFSQSKMSAQLDPVIRQVVENYHGNDPQALGDAVNAVRKIIDEASGLSDIEISLRDLPQKAMALSQQLQGLGVSLGDSTRLAAQWTVQQLSQLRDQITGHQQSRAEQMQQKQEEAALFNAQVVLIRAQLEVERAKIEAQFEMAMAQDEFNRKDLDIQREILNGKQEILREQNKTDEDMLKLAGGYLYAQDVMMNASAQALQQQLAAIDQIIANLPKPISPGEIHLPGTGGAGGREPKQPRGGGYGGPSKADQIKDFNAELERVAQSLLPSAVAQFKDLNDWLKRMTDEATRLGQPLDQINQLYQEQLDLLKKQAQAEVRSKSANPFQAQLDAILEWRDSMIEVYTALGLDLTDIATATADQIAKLKGDVMASLGVAGAAFAQQVQAAADALTFLRDNLDLLGLSAEDLARITAEVSQHFLQGILEGLAQLTDNEEVKRQLEVAAYQIRIAELKAEIEVLYAMGFLAQDLYDWIKGIIAGLPELPPMAGDTGGGGGFTGAGDQSSGKWQEVRSALDRLRSAIDRLREFQESMNQDTSISPLTLEQRFADAQAHYQDILAQAQAGNVDAIEALPDVAQQYLELAAQLYGTAGAGYGEIFQSVYDAVGAIVDNFDAEADRWQHLLDGQHDTNHILTQQSNLMQTANGLLQQIAGGGGGYPGAPPPQGIPGGIGEQMARVLQFPSGLQIIAQAGTSPPHAGGPPPPPPFPGIPDKKQRNPDFSIPGWGVGHLPSPTAHREVVVAIEKMHSGMKDELQDLRAENEALRKEVNGLRRDHRASTTATRDAITKGASGGGGGLVRLPMPSTSNRRSA